MTDHTSPTHDDTQTSPCEPDLRLRMHAARLPYRLRMQLAGLLLVAQLRLLTGLEVHIRAWIESDSLDDENDTTTATPEEFSA